MPVIPRFHKNYSYIVNIGLIIFIILVLIQALCPVVSAEDPTHFQNTSPVLDHPKKTILFVSDTSNKYPIFQLWEKGLAQGLAKEKDFTIDLVVEPLDIIRYKDPVYIDQMITLYQYKLEKLKPDAIFTFNQESLDILRRTNSTYIQNIPIITTRMNGTDNPPNILLIPSFPIFFNQTIEMALSLLPDTRHVYIIAGNNPSDNADTLQVKQSIDQMELKVPVEYLTNLTLEELEQRVSSLPDKSIIYYIRYSGDSQGNYYIPTDIVSKIREITDVPIFGGTDTYIGKGIVGGYIPSTPIRGEMVAQTIIDYLHGKTPGDSYFRPSEYMQYVFDWREIKRLGINQSNLPKNAQILYKEDNIYEKYYGPILLVIFIIFVESLLITGLLINRRNRILAERNLKESEERFRVLVEQAPEAITVIDIENNQFINANRNAERLFGYNRDEILKHGLNLLCPPDSTDSIQINRSIQDKMEKVMSGEEVIFEQTIRSIDGVSTPCEIRFVKLPSQKAQLIRASYIDISSYKQTEAELEHRVQTRTNELQIAQEAFKQANIKLNLLSRITRHDILNGVTALLGYLEMSRDLKPSEQIDEYLKSCLNITKIIQSQIDFTSVYDNIGTESPKWQNIELILEKIKSNFSTQLNFHGNVHGIEIYADPLLEKVFFTFIENTIRHSVHATDIWASYELNNTDLIIRYEDNGIGVPNSDKKKIFKRGFGKNTGFGLFISQEILAITQLNIEENGEEGKGVRFEITVPQKQYKL
ncbi:PAS domain S-box protein [Methanospirillum lacunae]